MTNKMSIKDLRVLQKHALYLLRVFDGFCIDNNLKYTISFGTLLGALRGGEVIPWDDDIDVVMMRDDYERFVDLAKSHLNENVFVQNYQTDRNYIHAFTRLAFEGTLAVQEAWQELDFHKGIFIDVFPLDKIAPEEIKMAHAKQINFYRRCKLSKLKAINEASYSWFVDKVKRILLFPFSMSYLNHRLSLTAQKFNDGVGYEVASLCEGIISYYFDFSFDSRLLDNLSRVEFEGDMYPAPRRSVELLSHFYGDFMEFPAKVDRVPHHGFIKLKFRDDIDELLDSLEDTKKPTVK